MIGDMVVVYCRTTGKKGLGAVVALAKKRAAAVRSMMLAKEDERGNDGKTKGKKIHSGLGRLL